MTGDEYVARDATALAELVRHGDVTAVELLEIALARVEALNPTINAVVRLMEDDARQAAEREPRGIFGGVPFLAKDLVSDYEGHPTSKGSRLLAAHAMAADTEQVRRVRATGVSVLGKTNLPEWGLLPVTEPQLWGPCRNPWNRDMTPGGSSGGAGAAVAAGIVPMAGGGDGGGSLRIPASCCGLFGLKPTRGRTPTGPRRGQLWRGATVEHVVTRSVRDSAAMLDATHGPDPGAFFEIPPPARPFAEEVTTEPERLKIAWSVGPPADIPVHPDCIAAVDATVPLLEELGHEVVPATPPIDGAAFARAFLTIISGELAADLVEAEAMLGRRAKRNELEPTTWALGLLGKAITSEEYALALRHLELVARDVGAFFEDFDVLLTPTLAQPPLPIGAMDLSAVETLQLRVLGAIGSGALLKVAGLLEEAAKKAMDFTPWTPIYNATGQPAMSVPLHHGNGLPIGVHFVGHFGHEATLFRLAGQLERARPWFHDLPPIAIEAS